jgi:hypothetical protein
MVKLINLKGAGDEIKNERTKTHTEGEMKRKEARRVTELIL